MFMPMHRNGKRRILHAALSLFVLTSCADLPSAPPLTPASLTVEVVADGFDRPLYVGAPTRDPRLFVGERAGRVWIIRDGARLPDPFLDLSAVTRTQGNEDGLLSVAFHPDYQTNRFVFVSFVELDGAIRLARFTASASDPNRVDPASRLNIRRIPHTGFLHYGGMIQFLPDRTLLMSIGDAGSGNSSGGDSQLPSTLRGKLVRLDVNTAAPFVVPSDNPFVGIAPFRPEVFALGLRNPWRFWVDEPTRQLFIADVGEGSFEELNVITLLAASGANFGWSFLEGPLCLPASPSCDLPGRVDPDVSYPHGPGCNSITGGVVYRGRAHPEHVGRYFYSDFCQGWLRSLRAANGEVSEQLEWTLSRPMPRITSFGLDGAGELYAVSYRGEVFRIGGGSR